MASWERAFTEVASMRGDALMRYAYLLSGNATEAADLVHEGLLRTFRRARLGTDLHRIEAYVRRAVLNAYFDGARKRQRFGSIRHLLTGIEPARAMDDSVAEKQSIAHALARLSPRQRACVVLRFYEDMTVADIAEQLGCSDGAVKRHLSDAIARMRPSCTFRRRNDPMTDQPPIKQLLHELAAQAPPFQARSVLSRIRRARQRRAAVMGAATLAVAAVGAGGTIVGIQWFGTDRGLPAADAPGHALHIGGCGERVEPAVKQAAPIRMTLAFPTEVRLADGGLIYGKATFTNVSDQRQRLYAGPDGIGILAKHGVVVSGYFRVDGGALPPLELAPGTSKTVGTVATLFRCDVSHVSHTGNAWWQENKPDLAPGTYELYGLTTLARGDSERVEVSAGPYPITLR